MNLMMKKFQVFKVPKLSTKRYFKDSSFSLPNNTHISHRYFSNEITIPFRSKKKKEIDYFFFIFKILQIKLQILSLSFFQI